MVIAEGTALIASIKGTIDIVKGLKASNDANTIMKAQSDILEQLFQSRIEAFALHEKASALNSEKEELINKVREFEQWGKTESEYNLKEVKPGIFAYVFKESQNLEIPTHWLCANCWNDRKKSIFQKLKRNYNITTYETYETTHICLRCKTQI